MRIMKMTKWAGGKGSTQRPVQDKKAFDQYWDNIFAKHKQDVAKYDKQLRERGVEPPNKKHYGDKHAD